MGIFDRIKRVNIRSIRKKIEQTLPAKGALSIVLDATKPETWAQQLVEEFGLDAAFEEFQADVGEDLGNLERALAPFTDEQVLQAIPERARTINELHGREYAEQTRKLLRHAQFTGLYEAEGQISGFLSAAQEYRDLTGKNASALREFMHGELAAAQALLKQLEDRCIAFAKHLEDTKFPLVRQIRDAHTALAQMDGRREKYQQLAAALQEDLAAVQEKIGRIEEKIRSQRGLIRNEEAIMALDQLSSVEEEMSRVTLRYGALAGDVLKYYRKHPQREPPRMAKRLLDDLAKDQARILAEGQVHDALAAIAEHLQEHGQGNTRQLIDRLTRLAEQAQEDGAQVKDALVKQRTLRQTVLRDVAAIAIYDQQQFLRRARHEEAEIQRKLAFVDGELDPSRRIEHERAMKDAAIALGATISGQTQES